MHEQTRLANRRRRPAAIRFGGGMLAALTLVLLTSPVRAQVPKSDEIQRRYIPASELQAVLAGDHPAALLPAAEFEELLKAAAARSDAAPNLPEGLLITRGDYKAAIEKDRLRLTARVELRSFREGWQSARISVAGLGVLSASIAEGSEDAEQKAAPSARNPENLDELLVFVAHAGRHVLTLELTAPLNAVASDRLASVGLSGAPSGELTIELPAGQQLAVDHGVLPRPAADDQPATYVLPIGARKTIPLTITERRSTERADLATFAATAIGVKASPAESTWTARTRLSVFGRPLDRLECTVPAGLEITSVESMGLEGWELSDAGAGRTKITLTWRQPVDGVRPIELRGVFSPQADGLWSVPNLVLQDVASHTGVLILERPAGVRLQVLDASGLRQTSGDEIRTRTEAGEQPQPEQDASSLFFQIWNEDFTLTFRPATKDREVQAAMTTLLSLNAQGADLLSTIDFDTRFAPLFEADVELPAAWQILSVSVGGQPAQWQIIPREAGRNRLRVTLTPPLQPGERRNISLSAHFEPETWPVRDEPVRLAIPEVRLPQAGVVEALYGIAADGDLDLAPVDLVGLDPARRLDLESLNRQLSPFGKTARLGFTYQDTVFQGQLEVRRLPARLSATCITLTRLEPEAVRSHVEVQLSIGGGGLRELIVNLPEAAGRDIRFQLSYSRPAPIFGQAPAGRAQLVEVIAPPGILEQQPQPAANGVIPWLIKLDRYARGEFVLQAEISQPRGAAAESQSWQVPAITVLGADRQTGAIGIEASDDQHLVVDARTAAGQPLERLDPIDFPSAHARPQERLVAAFAWRQPGWIVTLTEDRLTRIPLPTAIVHSLKLDSIIDGQGLRQTEARAELVAVGVQSLRVELPGGTTIWSALVDERPVEVRKSGEAFTIPLSPVTPPETRRTIRLIYANADASTDEERPTGSSSIGGLRLRAQPPQFSVVTGAGDDQPLEILETAWQVHRPQELELIDSRGVFHPVHPLRGDSAMHRALGLFWPPHTSGALLRLALLAGILLMAWLLTAAWSRSWLAFLGALLVVGLLPVVFFAWRPTLSRSIVTLSDARRGDMGVTEAAPATPMSAPSPAPSANDFADVVSDESLGLARMRRDMSENMPAPAFEQTEGAQPLADRSKWDGESRKSGAASLGMDVKMQNRFLTPQDAAPPVEFGRGTAQAPDPARQPPPPPAAKPGDSGLAGLGGGGQGRMLFEHQGLLSVAIALAPPEGTVTEQFRTTASQFAPQTPALDVAFGDANQRDAILWLLTLIVAALGWTLRRAALRTRLMFLLITIIGPIALRNLVSIPSLIVLDGVWMGGLLTAMLWLVRAIVLGISTAVRGVDRRVKPVATTITSLLILVCFAGGASAQDAAPAAPPAATAYDAATPLAVYIPYGDPADPLAARNVFVPRQLFTKLWNAAHPEQIDPGPAPRDGVVAAASFAIDASTVVTTDKAASAVVQSRFLLHNFRKSSIKLLLPVKTGGIRSAVLDGQPAVVEVDANSGALQVVIPETGLHVLDLVFEHSVQTIGPAGRFQWISDPVAAGRLTIRLPAGPLEARVDGVLAAVSPLPQEGDLLPGNVIEIAIDRGGQHTVSWQPPAERSLEELPVQWTTTAAATIDDTGLTLRSSYTLRVRQGSISETSFRLPQTLSLKMVEGPDVGGWRIDGDGDARQLTISFLKKIDSQTEFRVEVFQPQAIGAEPASLRITPIEPVGSPRESGRLGLYAEPHLSIRPVNVQGLIRDEVSQFTAPPGGTPSPTATLQYAYRFGPRPLTLDVAIERRQPETRVAAQQGVFVSRRKLQVSSRFDFQIAGAPRTAVAISLPAGYLLVDVSAPQLSDYSVADEASGGRTLTVELQGPQTGALTVLLNGVVPRRAEQDAVEILLPAPQDVSRLQSDLAIWVDDADLATIESAGDWKPSDPASQPETLRGLRPQPAQFAFRGATAQPAGISMSLRRQAPELSAESLVLIAVTDASVDYGLTLQWRITRAATDTFSFTTPGWLRGKLDFAGAGIRQVSSAEAPNDRVRWTISLTDPVRDRLLLTAAASLPVPADDRVVAPDIVFETPTPAGGPAPVDLQRHFAITINLSRQTLSLEDSSAVEPVLRENLPLKLPDALVQQAMSIGRILPGRTAAWVIRRIETTASSQATVTGAELKTTLDWDGSWRTQAAYTVRNRGRQFLPIEPPEGGRLLSVLVRGVPTRTVATQIGEKSIHLVPLPPSSEADLSYDVVLHFAGKLANPLPQKAHVTSVSLALPAPRVLPVAESAEYGLPVAQTAWVVTLPEGVSVQLDDSSNLTSHHVEDWGLLAESRHLTRLEQEVVEMAKIAQDAKASTTRREQAKSNLQQLGKVLKGSELLQQRMSQTTDGSAVQGQLIDENRRRNYVLQQQIEEGLQLGEQVQEGGGAIQPQVEFRDKSINFRQGSFDVADPNQPPADQREMQGRNLVIFNCVEILNANTAVVDADQDGVTEFFSFSLDTAASTKSFEAKVEESSRGRSALKRSIQSQTAASAGGAMGAPGLDSLNLGFGSRITRGGEMRGMGGMMGGQGPGQQQAAPPMSGEMGDVSGPVSTPPVIAAKEWTRAGGLSLALQLPEVQGRSFAYSKSGGDPVLVLRARSLETTRVGKGLLEAILWVALGLWLLAVASHPGRLARASLLLATVAAGFAFVVLPKEISGVALLLFVVAAVCVLIQGIRNRRTTTQVTM